jgi:hypothetical protein
MIVAIVDVLTSFNFFSSLYTICYILFYVPSPPLLALVFFVYCNNCHFGRSPAEIVGSNPTGGMDICLL